MLDSEGFSIPFPQQDVHFKTDALAKAVTLSQQPQEAE